MIRILGSVSGITMQPPGLDLGLIGSNIKSIQNTLVDLNGIASANLTISTVDTAKSIILLTQAYMNGDKGTEIFCSASFGNATTVAVNRGSTNGNVRAYITVIEFQNVKSVQKVNLSQTGVTEQTYTISNVNINKSYIAFNYYNNNTSTVLYGQLLACRLSASAVVGVVQSPSPNFVGYCWVVEFN